VALATSLLLVHLVTQRIQLVDQIETVQLHSIPKIESTLQFSKGSCDLHRTPFGSH